MSRAAKTLFLFIWANLRCDEAKGESEEVGPPPHPPPPHLESTASGVCVYAHVNPFLLLGFTVKMKTRLLTCRAGFDRLC